MRFRVWAPAVDSAGSVRVRIRTPDGESDHPMSSEDDDHPAAEPTPGWWSASVSDAAPGTDYAFLLGDDDTPLPDPRSPWQPEGVHGFSRVYADDAFAWTDDAWTGRALPGAVVYELHVGTFSASGTFDGVAEHLDHLAGLGIDAVELLPVNAFNGTHNWGYDGVDWYAVQESYGGPDGLKRLVDACHGRGIAVFLDVVYNHLGPSGNYLDRFGPYLARGTNTWGQNLNLDGNGSDVVRRHIIDNALRWLRDFHVDGLRVDAVHALPDSRAIHLLEEMATEVDALSTFLGRPLTLIAESDLNDPRLVTERTAGGYGLTAQWSDDFHHALHTVLTGERQGYYADFGSLETLAQTLRSAFFHADTWSSFRGRRHGRPVDTGRTPGFRFLGYVQNHDQIGNRALGDRISTGLSPGLLKVGAALVLCSPFTPMLFMGEEWAARTPWQFFSSHPEAELAAAVGAGRVAEFAEHGWDADDVPDPQDEETFRRSKLDWTEPASEQGADMLAFYRQLIALRHRLPDLTDPRLREVQVAWSDDDRWLVLVRGSTAVAVNLAGERQGVAVPGTPARIELASSPGFSYRPGEVLLDGESVAVLSLAV
ncbi:MAG: malto-oligosyltrehalose trehalohydrolase [Mycobacteriales bacterium]